MVKGRKTAVTGAAGDEDASSMPATTTTTTITTTSLSMLTPSSSASSVNTMPDTPVDGEPAAPSSKRILALAPAFQPRAVSFPAQFMPASNGHVVPNGAPIRVGAASGHARTHSSSSSRHLRSVSMPDVPRPLSPGAQYNEAYEALAAKYLKTPQLNYLAGNDFDAPSPPSSPESVLFIEQTPSGGLPKHFLRRRRGNSVAVIVEKIEHH
ncbi:hypothetical protein EXIGLDRAFT_773057, partial [Exidia glandulosa HHB12029]